jgi:hypothetical protein
MEIERKIEVEFESNEKDFQRVLFWYHWKRMLLEYISMIIIGIPLCYFFGFNVLDIKNNGWAASTFVAALLILLALDIYKRCFMQANRLKKIAKPSKTIFSERGIESKTPTTSSSRDWSSYAKIYETAKDFIFFQQENAFATIPKRFFKNQGEIEALRELVGRKLGERAKLQN